MPRREIVEKGSMAEEEVEEMEKGDYKEEEEEKEMGDEKEMDEKEVKMELEEGRIIRKGDGKEEE